MQQWLRTGHYGCSGDTSAGQPPSSCSDHRHLHPRIWEVHAFKLSPEHLPYAPSFSPSSKYIWQCCNHIPPPHTHTYVLFVIDTFSHWSSNMPSRLKSVMNISWMKLPHIILRKGLSNIKLPMWIYNGKIAQSLNRHKTFAQSLMSVLQTDTLAYQKKDYFYTYNILIRHIRLAHISFIDH